MKQFEVEVWLLGMELPEHRCPQSESGHLWKAWGDALTQPDLEGDVFPTHYICEFCSIKFHRTGFKFTGRITSRAVWDIGGEVEGAMDIMTQLGNQIAIQWAHAIDQDILHGFREGDEITGVIEGGWRND